MGNQERQAALGADAFLELSDIVKIYSSTIANDHISLHVDKGDILGFVGANGAGKSTLMRIISGVTKPEKGTMKYEGEEIEWKSFSPAVASKKGIRVAYQELSLCSNLKVYENFYVELSEQFGSCIHWRAKAVQMARDALNEVFPDNDIDVKRELAELSLAQQQMVEISRACADPALKLLILDEPTSSLPIEQTQQLLKYIQKRAAEGVTFIYITHRLFEIISVTNRVCILKNGAVVGSCYTKDVTEAHLIEAMSGETQTQKEARLAEEELNSNATTSRKINDNVFVKVDHVTNGALHDVDCEMHGGEIIGISGLEGNGQKDLIHKIFQVPYGLRAKIKRAGAIAYVTGDRKAEGNFPLWSIADNIAITSLVRKRLFAVNPPAKIVEQSTEWYNKLKVKGESPAAAIVSLSGGNQQKVMIARALQANADIIILDDPTRGVDVETKHQLYNVFCEAANAGKLVIWYSSDDSELGLCTRLFVMRYGTIVKTLEHDEISKDSIVEASFKAKEHKSEQLTSSRKRKVPNYVLSVAVMVAMYLVCGLIHKSTLTMFGAELLIASALPLAMAAISQTFIVGLSEVNLSMGNYMGFACVITATLVYENPLLGIPILLVGWVLFGLVGVMIRKLELPAVIVTLGFSFVWFGMSMILLQTPGGTCPQPLYDLFNGNVLGFPNVLTILILAIILATLMYRSKYGTVLRGFGNREDAMTRSGWSRYKAAFTVYMMAGFFATLGGLSFTAVTGTADAGSMDAYTMLTIASVVLGGGALSGGRVNHLGAACGAITLSLVTILLGFLHVSSDYTAAVNGLLLILILSLRLLRKGGKEA